MKSLTVRHITTYMYTEPVQFGEHRLMFRPRDSHDMRLLSTSLTISPPAQVRWLHDVFGNSIAIATFAEAASELSFTSEIVLEHFGITKTDFPLDHQAETYPFVYDPDELPDLMPSIERRYPDPERRLEDWVKQFYSGEPVATQDMLVRMTQAIKEQFAYQPRYRFGTQTPLETLSSGSGTCRDYALLMMEATRLRHRIFVRRRRRRHSGRPRWWSRDARLGAGLPARRRLGGIRSHEWHHRRRKPDPGRGRTGPTAGGAVTGKLPGSVERLHRYDGGRSGDDDLIRLGEPWRSIGTKNSTTSHFVLAWPLR
jgi:hypothetical protein